MSSTGETPQSQPPIPSASETEQQPSSMSTSSSSPTKVRASEIVHPTGNQHDPKAKASGEIPPTSVFVNSEPMREEQVQNAVKFLSHPKVRGSPVIYRRSFLEKKGLMKEEIDEAFRRVPDPPQNVSSTQPAADGQTKPLTNTQPQISTQNLQPPAAAPAGVISTNVTQSQFHWSRALLAVGFLALSGAGTAVLFKNAVLPRLKSWIRKVVLEEEEEESAKKTNSKPSLEQEAAAAAKAAAAAAADVARASQEMVLSKTEEKKYFEELMNLIGVQVQEMKSMSNAIQKLEVQGNTPGRTPLVEQDHRVPAKSLRQSNANGHADFDLYSARSSSPLATVEPSVGPHPKSYMDIMAMVQRGEKPPNIREINDLPPNPNQPLPNANSAPRAKPWELGQTQNSYGHVLQSNQSSYGLNSNLQDNGLVNQLNGDSSVPWWQRKNVRITEVKNEDEMKNGSSGVLTNEQPVQRSWVPPQPPHVAMPEAAAAIRQLKKPASQKQVADDRLVANPSEVTDELQRVTKISESGGVVDAYGGNSGLGRQFSESGGAVDANGESSGPNTNEIQEEQEVN